MKLIILAAGEGKRLRPLTKGIPKCMVKIFGKNIIEYQILAARSCGINDIIIVTGYCREKIKFSSVKYYTNEKFDSTNMIETLFCAKKELEGSVIVSYGDIIFENKILKKLIKSKDDFSVIIDTSWRKYWSIRFSDPLDDVESLQFDKAGYIKSIGQKVSSIKEIKGQYIGLIKIQNKGLKILKKHYKELKNKAKFGKNPLNSNLPFEKSYMTDLLQSLINSGYKIKAVPIHNSWLELDSLHDYKVYKKMYKDGTISKFINLEENLK